MTSLPQRVMTLLWSCLPYADLGDTVVEMNPLVGPSQDVAEPVVDRLVGKKPTPRVLLLTDDRELIEQVPKIVPTSDVVGYVNEIRQEEYDLVIATRPIHVTRAFDADEEAAGHLFIIAFGVEWLGSVEKDGRDREVCYRGWSKAQEYKVPGGMPSLLAPMVERDLLPVVQARTESHAILTMCSMQRSIADMPVVPLLKTGDNGYLAALWRRTGDGAMLALPEDVKDRIGWIRAALKLFRTFDPSRFQQIPGWEELPEWCTAEEHALQAELKGIETERQRVTADLDRREADVIARLAGAAARADTGLRRLLTTQGDHLPEVVAEALTELGFEVKLMDPEASPGNRLEDLRVTDPDVADWEALVEVRGYKGGAQLGDLGRVDRFVRRYRDENERWPPAVWYIVNQRAGLDPELRQPILSSHQAELNEWAHANAGMACDTTDLFRLAVAVEAEDATKEEARHSLRDASVRFTYP